MPPVGNRVEVIARVGTILDVWLEYDATGDPTVFEQADVFTTDIVEITPGKPPIVGKEAVLECLDTLDPTTREWEHSIEDIAIGRDLVAARTNSFGRTVSKHGEVNTERVIDGIDAFRRQENGTLKEFLSVPSPTE